MSLVAGALALVACGVEIVGDYVDPPAPPPPETPAGAPPAPPPDAGCLCPRDFACEETGCVDRALAHFRTDANPSANWSWHVQSPGKALELMGAGYVDGVSPPVEVWAPDAALITPAIWFNPLPDASAMRGYVLAGTELGAHPGPDLAPVAMRWTAPEDGLYRVRFGVRALSDFVAAPATRATIFARHNAAVHQSIRLSAARRAVAADIPYEAYAAGDVFDLVVTAGDDNVFNYDAIGVSIEILARDRARPDAGGDEDDAGDVTDAAPDSD